MLQIVKLYTLKYYIHENGKQPFTEWMNTISDHKILYRIFTRLERVALGNLGDHKFITNGVYELRCNFGDGIRIYYGKGTDNIILLLCGGSKKRQTRDIKRAVTYWTNYCENLS